MSAYKGQVWVGTPPPSHLQQVLLSIVKLNISANGFSVQVEFTRNLANFLWSTLGVLRISGFP